MENESPVISAQDESATLKGDGFLSVSRKREREASLEPQTPKGETDDSTSLVEPRKRPVAKKNRLESLDEEDSSSPPKSPPLDHPIQVDSTLDPDSTTNAHQDIEDTSLIRNGTEAPKMREIQKQVKDLSWQDTAGASGGATIIVEPPPNDHPMRESTASPDKMMDTEKAHDHHDVQAKQTTPIAALVPLPEEPDKNDEIVTDIITDIVTDDVEKKPELVAIPEPSPSQDMKPQVSPIDITNDHPVITTEIPAPSSRVTPPPRRRSTDSDPPSDTDLTLSPTGGPSRKRKLIAREISTTDPAVRHEENSKRSRDSRQHDIQEAEDDNEGRPPKRVATPPPSGAVSPPTSPPKRNGFGSFSSVASPFASVTGNAFGAAPQPKTFGSGGFGAYMSSSSPFAKVGNNAPAVFGQQTVLQKAPSFMDPTPSVSHQPLSSSSSRSTPSINPFVPTSPPTRSRSRSPSTSSLNRRKSPPPPTVVMGSRAKPGQAFGSYNNSRVGFASANASRHSPSPSLDTTKTNGGDSPANAAPAGETVTPTGDENKNTSWGEMLGSQGNGDTSDDDTKVSKKLKVEEVEVTTGEENENTRYQVRAKLFQLDTRGTFKERGTGLLKINVRKTDGSGARLVMRADGVYRLILNVLLFPGMHFSVGQDPRYLKLASIENGVPTHYALRVNNAKVAQELYNKIESHIPTSEDVGGGDDPEGEV